MDLATITVIIVAACGALILGMAALIKGMVVGKLEELQETINALGRDHHKLDTRVARLEEWRKSIGPRVQEGV